MERARGHTVPTHRSGAVTVVKDVIDVAMESEDSRWRQWKANGRADDLRFRRRLRMVLIDVAAVIAIGGALWFAFLI